MNAQGHDYTLLLNEAYKVLMRDNSMHAGGRGRSRVGLGVGYTGDGYSSWNGPVRSQALFVDENKCIGTYPESTFFFFIVELNRLRIHTNYCSASQKDVGSACIMLLGHSPWTTFSAAHTWRSSLETWTNRFRSPSCFLIRQRHHRNHLVLC